MNLRIIEEKKVSSASKIRKQLPITKGLKEDIIRYQKEIKTILDGTDNRKLLIVGPCSAWPNTAVLEYAKQLKEISNNVEDKLKIVMRTYIQKPRTNIGWKGPMNQPDPFKEEDIEEGIKYCRKMMIDVCKIGLPIADEAVFTYNGDYFLDLLSWVAIGARTSESQQHRVHGSMLNIAAGYKNLTLGGIEEGINSIITAQYSHVDLYRGKQIRTLGNPYAHLILRGGGKKTNYDKENLEFARKIMLEKKLENPAIIVDASHENSIDPQTGKKDPYRQPIVIYQTIETIKQNPQLEQIVKGFMCESFLENGNHTPKSNEEVKYGLSITDACIGIDDTKKMIYKMHELL